MKSADLCWGQRYIWLRHHRTPSHARHDTHIVSRFDLPEDVTLGMVRSILNALVRRYEVLRTTYHFDADADPVQRVHPPSAVPLVQVTSERDGTATPGEVVEELSTTGFDLGKEWPVRACVITTGGVPEQLVLVLDHVAFDAWTVERFGRELEAIAAGVAAGRPAVLEPVRHQPLDLAGYEASVAAQEVKQRRLAFWRAAIAELPSDTFGARRRPESEPSARSATLASPSMLDVSRAIAGRHRVWPSHVHIAVYSAVLAAYTGCARIAHLSFAGNRGSTLYTDVMTCMFSPMLISVDCHDNPRFSELLRRASQRFEQAQEHSPVPYDEFVELMARESSRRGHPVRAESELNFLSHASHRSRARRTKFTWNQAPSEWATYGSDTYFRIYELQDAVAIVLHAASAVMDAESMERFLRGYEAVLLAHEDPAQDLRIDQIAQLVGFSPVVTEPAPVTGPDRRPTAARSAPVDSAAARSVLATVVGQANGLDTVDLTECYASAGGRVLRIPRVLALLDDHGWTGLGVRQLSSGEPLGVLAARLRPSVGG